MYKTYEPLVGRQFGDLYIDTILRYECGQPVYGCRCNVCKTSNVAIPHRHFVNGVAQCTSSEHRATLVRQLCENSGSTSLASIVTLQQTSSSRLQAERAAFNRASAPVTPQPVIDTITAQRQRERTEQRFRESQRQEQQLADYREYVRTAMTQWGRDLETLPTLETWRKIADDDRERIMTKVRR